MKLALVFKAIELLEDLISAVKSEELSDDDRAALKSRRDAVNQKLADLDVPTDVPTDPAP